MLWTKILVPAALIFVTISSFNELTASEIFHAVRGQDAVLRCGPRAVFLDGPNSYLVWIKDDKDILYRYPSIENRNIDPTYTIPCEDSDMSCNDGKSLIIKNVVTTDEGMYRCRIHYQGSPTVDFVYILEVVDPPRAPLIFYNGNNSASDGIVRGIREGENLTLRCELYENRTRARIYWAEGDMRITNSVPNAQGVAKSDLLLENITRSYNEKTISCVAIATGNSKKVNTSVTISMSLAPTSIIISGHKGHKKYIAGEVYLFDCIVNGSSPFPLMSWFIGNNILDSSNHVETTDGDVTMSSARIIFDETMKHVDILCRARNFELKENFDANITVEVGFPPRCRSLDLTIGAVVGEQEHIVCEVRATPQPDWFNWVLPDNRTVRTHVVHYTSNFYGTSLDWTPERNYSGKLACYAGNTYGNQIEYCFKTVVQGGPPDTPNCTLDKIGSNLTATCGDTWDGGRDQTFHLELYEQDSLLVSNRSSTHRVHNFTIGTVDEKLNYTVDIYSTNSRGISDTQTLVWYSTYDPVVEREKLRQYWTRNAEIAAVVLVLLTTCYGFYSYVKSYSYSTPQAQHNIPDVVFHQGRIEFEERPLNRDYEGSPPTHQICRILEDCGAIVQVPQDEPSPLHHYYV